MLLQGLNKVTALSHGDRSVNVCYLRVIHLPCRPSRTVEAVWAATVCLATLFRSLDPDKDGEVFVNR